MNIQHNVPLKFVTETGEIKLAPEGFLRLFRAAQTAQTSTGGERRAALTKAAMFDGFTPTAAQVKTLERIVSPDPGTKRSDRDAALELRFDTLTISADGTAFTRLYGIAIDFTPDEGWAYTVCVVPYKSIDAMIIAMRANLKSPPDESTTEDRWILVRRHEVLNLIASSLFTTMTREEFASEVRTFLEGKSLTGDGGVTHALVEIRPDEHGALRRPDHKHRSLDQAFLESFREFFDALPDQPDIEWQVDAYFHARTRLEREISHEVWLRLPAILRAIWKADKIEDAFQWVEAGDDATETTGLTKAESVIVNNLLDKIVEMESPPSQGVNPFYSFVTDRFGAFTSGTWPEADEFGKLPAVKRRIAKEKIIETFGWVELLPLPDDCI
ncbi:hypothetical protein M2447_002031 [Ereboglobus sp. PH5-10]|uniref:hypothetical protein n=1 Tax=Ereboglobus sp. PH5-10 TaxID=2940629 RepID=UPI002404A494|nr:hypothetical protein [Ereboglobus sp. PH5-10]MDF9827926.1 hypothetical protein [Ereboglobus sp. PH5-10]